ncbi:Transposon Ty3-I Gag-Pol polyprotein [Gossypium australe]|uniref:Transposon Ty3-I Gag-Pol polyprotein n=1 Tax=Gossypium australe TaxID=47621 RepID=A0A5B6UUA7_9ROSI|nr:Transposon Ty3-I Gag-Pol polyprotein [Gossypium australe]
MVVDASSKCALLSMSYNETYEIIKRIVNNNYQWLTNRATSGRLVVGVHEMYALTSLAARRLGEFETIVLTKECIAFIQKKLPPKMKDPGSFTIPCNIGESYYGNSSIFPVIISAELLERRKERLFEVLKKFKKVIGWTIVNTQGISPSFCMHRIILEEGKKARIEGKKTLNHIMKEVVRKEVIKWLDAGIIYPISDSSWVSLVQCVPKNDGIRIVENECNELILTRTVNLYRLQKAKQGNLEGSFSTVFHGLDVGSASK